MLTNLRHVNEFTNLTSDFEKSGCAIASLATDDGRTIHIGTLSPSIPYELSKYYYVSMICLSITCKLIIVNPNLHNHYTCMLIIIIKSHILYQNFIYNLS